MNKKSIIKVIEACVLLVIGVLFCVSRAMGTEVLSIILGISLIVAGTVIVTLSIVNEKSVAGPLALGGLLALTLGIFFIAENAIQYIFTLVPYILIVFGAALLVEAFLGYFLRKEKVLTVFIIKIVVAIALIVVGILLLSFDEVKDFVALIAGIALILIAIDNIVLEFIKAKRSDEE